MSPPRLVRRGGLYSVVPLGSAEATGIVSGVQQPVVVGPRMRNVPEKGVYNWDPGAFFGVYRPETFWLAEK